MASEEVVKAFALETGEKVFVCRQEGNGYLTYFVHLEVPATKKHMGSTHHWTTTVPVAEKDE